MFLSWLFLMVPTILIVTAIIYASINRWTPIEVIYAGVGLFVAGLFVTLIPLNIVEAMNHFATWMETAVIASFINIFILLPTGLLFIAVGAVLYWIKKSKSARL